MRSIARLLKFGGPIAAAGLLLAACGGSEATATPGQATPAAPRPTATAAAATATSAPTSTPVPGATVAATATRAPAGPTATPRPVPTPTPTPIPPTPTQVRELPKRGGTIRKYIPSDPVTLDPTKLDHYTIFYTMDEVWSNLVQYKSDNYTQVEFIGDLADRWEVNSGGDIYTFFLNPAARWQNLPPLNGRPVTAQDVKWTYELMTNPDYGSQIGSRINFIKEITAINDKTVQIKLKEAANDVLYDLAWVSTKIHAKELFDQKLLGTEKGIIGSGPFMFDRWEKGSVVKLRRSANYWRDGVDGKGLPYLDGVDTVIIPDNQTHTAAIRAGQLDYGGITGLTPSQIGPLRNVQGLELIGMHPVFIQDIGFNMDLANPPMNNKKVRLAILKATDFRQIMRNALGQGPTAPIESFVYSSSGDLTLPQQRLEELTKRDVPGAKKLLADAGFPNGFNLELLIVFDRSPKPEIAALLKQQWEEIGLKVSLTGGPDSLTDGRRQQFKYDVHLANLNLDANAVSQIRAQFRTGAGRNFYKYSNPAADKLMDQSKTEFDAAKKKQVLWQVQEIMWDDLPAIPLPVGVNSQAMWSWVKGFKNHFAWGDQGLKYAWTDKK